MGTLERTQEAIGRIRRMGRDVPWRRTGTALLAIDAAIIYRDELVRRGARPHAHASAFFHEIEDLNDAIHCIAIACPEADPEAVWRGWTRVQANGRRQRVVVKRDGQMVVGRSSRTVKRFRARVEDVFAVEIGGQHVGRWLRAGAMKQARWATIVRADGTMPLGETNSGRRWRLYLYLLRREKRREARREERNAIAHRRARPRRPMIIRGRDVRITLRTPFGVQELGPTDVNVDDEFSIAPRRLPPRR